MLFAFTLLWIAVCLHCTNAAVFKCHKLCQCDVTSDRNAVLCDSSLAARRSGINAFQASLNDNCSEVLQIETLIFSFRINHLTISCVQISSPEKLVKFADLISLTMTHTNMTSFSLQYIQSSLNLNKLNLSSNELKSFEAPSGVVLANLQQVDLANNALLKLDIQSRSLPQVTHANLQNNQLTSTVPLEQINSVKSLNISNNPFVDYFNLTLLNGVHSLYVQSVGAIFEFNADTLCSNCPLLPPNVANLYLESNRLLQVPTCNGLLAGLHNLTVLQLDFNRISMIPGNILRGQCFATLVSLHLAHNRLLKVDSTSLVSLSKLNSIDLSYNYLQHLEPGFLDKFEVIAVNDSHSRSNNNQSTIYLHNNTWSCDCFLTQLQSWILQNRRAQQVFSCHLPTTLQSHFLEDVRSSDLKCSNVSIAKTHNITAVEYESGSLVCSASGVPRPAVHWLSPKGDTISLASVGQSSNQQDAFSLSRFGEQLTVHDVRLHKTGVFRCVADNNVSTTEATVALSVLLGQTSTIVLLSVACFAFFVAVTVNSINMCVYICEHIEKKRLYKKALQAQKEQEKQNPPIKLRSRSLDESMASLNANRHYSRYDFTCQQMFLDTVVKGAHSVKKTLYDARHSEFSANMWGYAANLRERLHIEMPSGVQLPSISMPSISMPSISMPTMPNMPTMQDINTNIEKLGSSMVQRSHTLATSVGSVFTLKRWMWQSQNNSSDNESRDSDENLLGEPAVTRVRVDVHPQEQPMLDTDDERPCTSKKDNGMPYHPGFQRSKSLTKNMQFGPNGGRERRLSLDGPTTSAIVNVQPNITTISSTVDSGHWHSYETSV